MDSRKRTEAEVLKDLLSGRGFTVSCAESCTGGNISHIITSVSGSSEYFHGAVVSYAVPVKEKILGVSPRTIRENGIVSSAVAAAMAEGVRSLLGSTFAVATTGWADAYGDEREPAGTVWIAVSGPEGTLTKKIHSGSTRKTNINRFSKAALRFLLDYISKYVKI